MNWRNQLEMCRQKDNETIDQYVARFRDLLAKIYPGKDIENDYLYQFLRGLHPEILEKGVEFALSALAKPDSKLLIHCVAGRHRGPMMALAVFCKLGWAMEDAMRRLSERRPVVDWAPVYVASVRDFLDNGRTSKGESVELSRSAAGPLPYGPDKMP